MNKLSTSLSPVYTALLAALLFGISTPVAKWLLGDVHPQVLAGLLYVGSGSGLFLWSLLRRGEREAPLRREHGSWLFGAILAGGILAPLALMWGLLTTAASAASLLLNLESVFTALVAWFVFREHFDRRIFIGMLSIVIGGCLLTFQPSAGFALSLGGLAIVVACLCWAIDNNLTRKVADADPVQIAFLKGIIAGLVNLLLAFAMGRSIPPLGTVLAALVLGFLAYGVSLVLFIKALRQLGAARTGAYFSTAPFIGAIVSVVCFSESISLTLGIAGFFMALGVWLHATEVHGHEHTHLSDEHEHLHSHDEHHSHEHGELDPQGEPHSHFHKHERIIHSHPHYPDTHHRHEH